MKQVIFIFALSLGLMQGLLAQGRPYEGPEDPAGDIAEIRSGYMNGNRAILFFENTTVLGEWGSANTLLSRWPNTYEGLRMLDHIFVMIGAEVYVTQDSVPVTDPDEIARLHATGDLDTLFFIQSHGTPWYVDLNYDETVEWQLYPVTGYFNEVQDYPAMSNKPDSWPIGGWPSTEFETKWPGEWNGRFGRGIQYAALETYFVTNDAQDLEYIVKRNDPEQGLIDDGPRYYPRPGRYIGDLNPDVTVQKGYPWGGLGLRVALRGFQWNNPEAKDMIFWEYDISNISDYDLWKCGFGYHMDARVGGDDQDNGYFNKELDLAYIWDWDGIGLGGLTPGVLGVAYLESPGSPYDGIDNDNDGLLDEQRDNSAGNLIGPYDGIYNLDAFLDFYNLEESDLRGHYEGDEDQDWQDGLDLNEDGDYSWYDEEKMLWFVDEGESPGDDVGLDGVGPMDLNYTGPDEGECNHMPDFREGVGCEPNFAVTDVSESDMIGLTSFYFFEHGNIPILGWWPKDDMRMWRQMSRPVFMEYQGDPITLFFSFSSATFPFYKGRTERISMGLLHAYENMAALSAAGHKANNLFKLKEVAQVIYEADYRFAQPPKMPTLSATAADGKVILSWNDVADKLTREPFLNNINDFEGYKLYKATDKLFSDAEVVTNSQGDAMFKKPIYQCDLIDTIRGHANYGVIGGAQFYLGDDTGISHYYVDEDVQNGRTYYYALVAYDYGAPDVGDGVAPSENNIVLELDEAEEIIRMGDNVAIATPHQPAAGYMDPSLTYEQNVTTGNARITPVIYDRNRIKAGHTYMVTFQVDTIGFMKRSETDRHPMDMVLVNNGLRVYDMTDQGRLVYSEDPDYFPMENIIERNDRSEKWLLGQTQPVHGRFYRSDEIITDSFDGIQLKLERMNAYLPEEVNQLIPDIGIHEETSGWVVGDGPINIEASKFEYYAFPYMYDIVFTDEDSASVSRLDVKTGINNLTMSETSYLFDVPLSFYVINRLSLDEEGEPERCELVVEDVNLNGRFDILEDRILVGHAVVKRFGTAELYLWGSTVFGFDFFGMEDESHLPEAGDIYRVDFARPFFESDSITFTVEGAGAVNEPALNATMDQIKVVPNPYVATNMMEPAVANKFLNQRRRLLFTHIPANCSIKIFTSSGILVDQIDVDNEPSNGTVHWDLLTREDLEVAAGMYIYHIKSHVTGKEKIGKFAVIK